MTQDIKPDYQQVADAVALAKSELLPSEWQGLILGSICYHLKTGSKPNLERLMFDAAQPSDVRQPLMELSFSAYRAMMDRLLSAEDILELMMPDDEEPVDYRRRSDGGLVSGLCVGLVAK